MALEEPTSNEVLVPLAWTQQGVWIERRITGIGGCCYLTPEMAGRDLLFVDPTSLTQRYVWKGCTASFINTLGSFSCGTEVHRSDGSTLHMQPLPPVQGIGWEMVDEADANLIFAVIHTRGTGDGGCPCAIDIERAPLGGGTTTSLIDQMTPDGVLPNGSIVARTAPAMPGQGGAYNEWIVSRQGKATQLGPDNAQFLAIMPLS